MVALSVRREVALRMGAPLWIFFEFDNGAFDKRLRLFDTWFSS